MNNIIERVAELHGVSPEKVEAEMKGAIGAAWDEPKAGQTQLHLFPEGEPSPTLFIKRVAALVQSEM